MQEYFSNSKNMTAQENSAHTYTVGDIIRTTEPFGPNPAGSVGIIYEFYPDHDTQPLNVVSVLLTNGHDIGSFNSKEQLENMTWIGHAGLAYTYSSPNQLMADYRNGYFEQAFAEARLIAENAGLADVEIQ